MTETLSVTGGCQCGAVRYSAKVAPASAHLCHCRMCQKAVGGPFAALVGVAKTDIAWTRGQPAAFRSSARVERGFCAACGTPLFYRADEAEHLSVTIGSLDDAGTVEPAWQVGAEAKAAWVDRVGSLRSYGETEANDEPELTAEIRRSNRQHPDHDTALWPVASLRRE